mgnify:CR=1 FL=1
MEKWVLCPACGKKLCRVEIKHDANLYLWCKRCKEEVKVHIEGSQNEP